MSVQSIVVKKLLRYDIELFSAGGDVLEYYFFKPATADELIAAVQAESYHQFSIDNKVLTVAALTYSKNNVEARVRNMYTQSSTDQVIYIELNTPIKHTNDLEEVGMLIVELFSPKDTIDDAISYLSNV